MALREVISAKVLQAYAAEHLETQPEFYDKDGKIGFRLDTSTERPDVDFDERHRTIQLTTSHGLANYTPFVYEFDDDGETVIYRQTTGRRKFNPVTNQWSSDH